MSGAKSYAGFAPVAAAAPIRNSNRFTPPRSRRFAFKVRVELANEPEKEAGRRLKFQVPWTQRPKT
jgi:hypothetical protein